MQRRDLRCTAALFTVSREMTMEFDFEKQKSRWGATLFGLFCVGVLVVAGYYAIAWIIPNWLLA